MTDDIQEKIQRITEEIASKPSADGYYRRGKLYWRVGDRQHAITDFNQAVQMDADSPAAIYLNMTRDVMDFYNTDLYNP
ncbi:MAG: tetratricopeptide repeat protein [Muribaculaceae bacterium]|nr:tetratricopeptide repeat protein [Muribaculaceae bacterium]